MNSATPPVDPVSPTPEAEEPRNAERREAASDEGHAAVTEGDATAAEREIAGDAPAKPVMYENPGAVIRAALRREANAAAEAGAPGGPPANVVTRAEARLAAESESEAEPEDDAVSTAAPESSADPASDAALQSAAASETTTSAAVAEPEGEAESKSAAAPAAAERGSDAPLQPEIAAPLEPEIAPTTGPAGGASAVPETLPIPAGPRRIDSPEARPGRLNFWKRLAMRRSERARNAAQTAELLVRVGELDERLEGTQARILGRLDRIEQQIDSVWVIEEQLSQLAEIQEKLETLRSEQRGMIEALARSGGQTTRSAWGSRLAFVVLLAAAAAAGAIALVRMGL